jgi:uncharacterized membrane protein
MVVETIRLSSTKNERFLDSKVVCFTDYTNEFHVSIAAEKNAVEINFRYLDKKEGAVIQILCENVDESSKFVFSGKIMGCKRFKSKSTIVIKNQKVIKLIRYIPAFIIFALLGTLITFLLDSIGYFNIIVSIILGCSLSIILITSIIEIIVPLKKYFKGNRYRMPKEFKKYFNH